VQHADLATASASRGDLGSASIGYVASAALSGLLPRLVYRFRQDHPAVRLAMREMDMPAQLDAVARGALDLGFIRPPLRALPEGLALLDALIQRIEADGSAGLSGDRTGPWEAGVEVASAYPYI